MNHVTAAMEAAVGTETARRVSFPIGASDIRRWAIAVYWPEPPPRLFWDAAYASGTRHRGIVAPEEFNPFAWMAAEEDHVGAAAQPGDVNRVERQLGIEGPDLRFELNGGVEVTYGVRMRPDDVITSISRLGGYSERAGRLGTMLLTVNEDTWSNQHGELVKLSRSTQIRY